MIPECDHGGDPHACPVCARERAADHGGGPAPYPDRPARVRTFSARYVGTCAGCDRLILPGDEIAAADDGSGYLCDDCTAEIEAHL